MSPEWTLVSLSDQIRHLSALEINICEFGWALGLIQLYTDIQH